MMVLLLMAGCAAQQPGDQTDLTAVTGYWRAELDGKYHLNIDIKPSEILITDGDVDSDIVVKPHEFSFDGSTFAFEFDHSPFMPPSIRPPTPGHGVFSITARVDGDTMTGAGTCADGKSFAWTATRIAPN